MEIRAITGHQTSKEVSRYTKGTSEKSCLQKADGETNRKQNCPNSHRSRVSHRKKQKEIQYDSSVGWCQGRNGTTDLRFSVTYKHNQWRFSRTIFCSPKLSYRLRLIVAVQRWSRTAGPPCAPKGLGAHGASRCRQPLQSCGFDRSSAKMGRSDSTMRNAGDL